MFFHHTFLAEDQKKVFRQKFRQFRFEEQKKEVFNRQHDFRCNLLNSRLSIKRNIVIVKSWTLKPFLNFLPDVDLASKIPDMSGKNWKYGNPNIIALAYLQNGCIRFKNL